MVVENIDTVISKSIFDMHFQGTHSLVLKDGKDYMYRLYVTEPGKFHESHLNWELPFLYHSHRYSFTSGPVIGRLNNHIVRLREAKSGWYKYSFNSPIFSKKASIDHIGFARNEHVSYDTLYPGDYYSMRHDQVHRVGFIPSCYNGWSVVWFHEKKDVAKSKPCYSPHKINDLSVFGCLYNKPSKLEINSLINRLLSILKE